MPDPTNNNSSMEQNVQKQNPQEQDAQAAAGAAADKGNSAAIDYEKLANLIEGKQKVTEDTVIKSYLKQQGLSESEMSEAISAFKAKKEAEKPDVNGMQSRISELEAQIKKDAVDRAAMTAAIGLGIDSKSMPYVLKLADMSKAFKADGSIDDDAVTAAINQVLMDVPAFKPSATENTGFHIGGAGDAGNGTEPKADEELMKGIFLGGRTKQSITNSK